MPMIIFDLTGVSFIFIIILEKQINNIYICPVTPVNPIKDKY